MEHKKGGNGKDIQKGYDDVEDDICNFHYIWYNKGKVDTNLNHHIKVASFDTWVKERSENTTRNINSKWVGYWMNAIFYELVKKVPGKWFHIPSGNTSNKIVLARLQTYVQIKYL